MRGQGPGPHDIIPDRQTIRGMQPGPRNTAPGESASVERQPLAKAPVDKVAGEGLNVSEYKPWAQPAQVGYEEYLGKDLYAKVQEWGMNNDDLVHYVDKDVYILARGTDMGSKMQDVRRMVTFQLSQLESMGLKNEATAAIKHGYSPGKILTEVGNLKIKGYTDVKIRQYLQTRNGMLDICQQHFPEQDLKSIIRGLRGFGSERVAIEQAYYTHMRNEFFKRPLINNTYEDPNFRVTTWYREAEQFVDEIRRQATNRP
jgi:hypothetical protein